MRGRIVLASCVLWACGNGGDSSSRVVGSVTVDLDVSKLAVRSRETLVSNLIADAIHADLPDVQVCLVNGGNLRFDPTARPTGLYPAGTWTEATVAELLPFDFEPSPSQVEETITGAQLKSVLERSVANLQDVAPPPTDFAQLKGWFLSGCGVRYTADLSQQAQILDASLTHIVTEGQRIVDLEVGGAPYDPAATYRVSGTEYMMAGMDGHVALLSGTDKIVLGMTSADMLVDYLAKGPATPALDGRIVIEKSTAFESR